jgi:hypothetical protein
MPVHPHFSRASLPAGRKTGFVLLVLFVSLLAHLFVIEWARDSLALVSLLDEGEDKDVVEVTLQTLPPPARKTQVPAASPLPEPIRDRAPDTSRLPDTPTITDTPSPASVSPSDPAMTDSAAPNVPNVPDATAKTFDSAADPIVTPATEHARVAAPLSTPAISQTDAAVSSTPSPTAVPTSEAAAMFSRISFPPTADLSYDAIAIKGSSKVEGRGLVKWWQDGRQYSISGEASVLFLSVLSYGSEGHLTDIGILPERYSEKRLGKSSTNTHFHRERQTISFSASTNQYPVKGGEQDRGSVFWQLAGLGRGNPDQLQAGLSFELIIAGSRTADLWQVTVLGREPVTLKQGSTEAWHLRIARQDGGADYQLEVWLAPAQDWYPVKILYVDRKGTTLGLTLSTLEKK